MWRGDSADVWAHPELFKLDKELRPTKVAGVPPDYFSETGQLWGNPIYDWSAHEKQNFAWWTDRLNNALETYDIVRIDHFRGIDRYYEIPAFAENAVKGEWKAGPGKKLFARIGEKDRFIAEDLGIIDEGVVSLRDGLGFPGMKVLLFAFDGEPENEFLPSNITENSVCYTGTHDNDTVAGYVKTLSAEELLRFRSRVAQTLQEQRKYIRLGKKPEDVAQALCKLALSVRSKLTVLPCRIFSDWDNSARMNHPSTEQGNWRFRLERRAAARGHAQVKTLDQIVQEIDLWQTTRKRRASGKSSRSSSHGATSSTWQSVSSSAEHSRRSSTRCATIS